MRLKTSSLAATLVATFVCSCSPSRESDPGFVDHLVGIDFPIGGGEPPPPGDGGTITLTLPSPDRYVVRVTGPFTQADLDALAVLGLTLEATVSETGGQVGLFHGPPGIPHGSISNATGEPEGTATWNIPVTLGDSISLTGGFVVSPYSPQAYNGGPNGLESLSLVQAASNAPDGGQSIKIAVPDTGVEIGHPAFQFAQFMAPVATFSSVPLPPDGIDNDANGAIDEAHGHGTHVAGIIHRIAPNAKILSLRFMNDDGVGSAWDLVRAMNAAKNAGVKIICLSIALPGTSSVLESTIERMQQLGIVVVAGAGNLGSGLPTHPGTSAFGVGIAAVDGSDVLTSFSGAGNAIEFATPGVDILSAYTGGGMATGSGTSMSSAAFSGCLALLAKDANITVTAAVDRFESSHWLPVTGGTIQYGRADLLEAVSAQ